ncbi:MAG: flagellar biosynthesis protein FlhF [Candidatus Cloacimonetes bacterium]|nr:flagellar biosynthesis protein FlhF [Candidatus Cloacimonadota bacterium]
MRVKTFFGKSVKDVLLKIKDEFGENAIILKTEHLPSNKVKDDLVMKAIAAYDDQTFIGKSIHKKKDRHIDSSLSESSNLQNSNHYDIGLLKEDFEKLRNDLYKIQDKFPEREINFTHKIMEYFDTLTKNGTHRAIAASIIAKAEQQLLKNKIHENGKTREVVYDEIVTNLNIKPIFPNSKPYIIALIGPTGVGKTTTIAKLATNMDYFATKKTALFSIDTFRIAAIQQLRTFANISNIPFEVIYKPPQLAQAVERHQDKDIILIDTIGRSPRNSESLIELIELFKQIKINEIHLLLSANMNENDMYDAYNRYKLVGKIEKIIFSKLDETSQPGIILNFLMMNNIPISYYTMGQNVPDDIRKITKNNFVNLFFHKETTLA